MTPPESPPVGRQTTGGDGGHARRRKPPRYDFSVVEVGFETADGRRCRGRLHRPDRPVDAPAVVLAPGVGLTRRAGLDQTAERLARRGYAALTFDYRGFGDSDGPAALVAPVAHRTDIAAAVDAVGEYDGVDADRLALWGLDVGAGVALAVAAEAPRVDAVVARHPVVDGAALVPGWLRPRLRGLAAAGQDRLLAPVGRGRSVPMFGEPGELALVTAPGAARGVARLPTAVDLPDRTPARSLWALWRHRVDDVAAVRCPSLFVADGRDEVAPVARVEGLADDVADASLVRVPSDHYEGLTERGRDRVCNHELAFLDAEL